MSKIVKGGLIQASLAGSSGDSIDEIKNLMIQKHFIQIEEASKKECSDSLSSGTILRSLFLRRTGYKVVQNGRKNPRRADYKTDAGDGKKI